MLSVNGAAVPDREKQNDDSSVFDPTDQTILADEVAPKAFAIRGESGAEPSRILIGRNPLAEVLEDSLLDSSVEEGLLACQRRERA
jgi:hypothetical protein